MKKIDYVIKIGGSVLYDFYSASLLLNAMYQGKQGNYVITVGSGYIGEMYKDFIYTQNNINIGFQDSVRDWANLQSINASILASINSNYVVCCNDQEIQLALDLGLIPIADARGFLSVFENDKYQKSDVRTSHLCNHLGCKNLIVLTNVDGIYQSDPRISRDAQIIKEISSSDLAKMGRTSVDDGLAERIGDYQLVCNVLGFENVIKHNGIFDEQLLKTGTRIKPSIQKEKTDE